MAVRNFRERSPLLIGIASLIAIAMGVTGAFFVDRVPFIKQAYKIQAEFADAAGLAPENQVRVAGIKVGVVRGVELAGDRVLATLEIDNDIEISRNAFAEIKLSTLLGTKFIDVQGSGSGELLEDGDVIPLERTAVPFEIHQAQTQGTDLLEDVDGEALNEMFTTLVEVTREAKDEIGHALAGLHELGQGLSDRQTELRSMLQNADDLTRLLADEGDTLVRLIDSSNEVLASLAGKREELQSLLEATKHMAGEVTAVVRENRGDLDSVLNRLHRALIVLERNVDDIDMAMRFAGPSSRYFGSVFTQGRWGDIYSCALIFTGMCE
jgi:phospholipid/cholesterol/gamma-HCH transport system substrate-binding protein